MKKLYAVTALALLLSCAATTANAESISIGTGTYDFTRKVDRQIAPGVQYTYFTCSSRGTYGTHVYVTTVDLTNPNVKIEYLTASGTMGGSVNSLANIAANNTSTGHTVVAGANANFWITSETPWKSQLYRYPHGTAVSNGVQYSVNPPKGSDAHMGGPTNTGSIVIGTDGRAYIKRFLYHYYIYHPRINHYMDLTDCNRVVEAGTASIYTRAYGTSKAFKPVNNSNSTWVIASGTCTEVICDLASGQTAKAGGDVKYVIKEVRTSAGTGTLGDHDLAIVGRDSYATVLAEHYQVGDEIVLQQHFNSLDGATADIIPTMYNATSGNCVTMEAGTIINDDYIQSQSSYNGTIYARTLYGTNDDGTKLWIAVCGNKTSTYYGMTTSQMTYFLKYLGATYAAQVDCGGSSQMYVDGSQVNKSTDSSGLRSVHSGIFVVSTSTATADPATLTTTAANTSFGELAVGTSSSKSFTVTGANLTGNITMTISGTNAGMFSVSPATILKADQSGTITVKYAPTAAGTHTATLSIATPGVTTKSVTLSGTAKQAAGANVIYQDDAAAYGVTASSSYDMELEYQDFAISELSGKTIKRVIARGDIVYILAHDASNIPTIVVYNHVTKSVIRTLGYTNAVIGVPCVSDIAITADGYLVGQGYATQAYGGTSMGLTYKWSNGDDGLPTGELSHWNLHNNSGNYNNAYIGETLVMQGDWRTGKFVNTAQTTGTSGDVRFTIHQLGTVYTEGQISSIWYNKLNSVSGYAKADLGDMLLFASPFSENNVILQGNNKAGAEFTLNSAAGGVPTKVADIPSIIPAAANHTGIFRFGGKIYMTSPTFTGSNSTGVMLVDITNGLSSGTKVTLTKSDMTSAATTNVATVGTTQVTLTNGSFVEARPVILAVRNGSVTKFIAKSTVTPPSSDDPVLVSDIPGTVSFGEVQVGESSTKSYKVEGSDLTGDITIAVSGDGFAVSPASIAKATAAGNFTVTFTPTSVGTKTGTVTISSPGATSITATLSGSAVTNDAPTGTGSIESLTEVWNVSTAAANTDGSFFNPSNSGVRSLAVNGDDLYVCAGTLDTPKILIVNSKTGKDTGRTVNVDGISGGIWCISHLEMLGSHLYASNCGRGLSDTESMLPLKIYRWNDVTSAPEVVVSYDVPDGWARLGEILSVWGDETNGRLMVYYLDNLVVFTVTNGTVSQTPTVITLSKTLGGGNSTTGVVYNGNDTYTIFSKDNLPTRIDASGNVVETLPSAAITNKYGTDAKVFDYGAHRYMAATAYKTGDLTGGVLDVIDITDGLSKASLKFSQPKADDGLGATKNIAWVTDVDVQLSDEGKTLRLWVLVPFQGAAMYTYSTATVTPEEPTIVSDRSHHAYNLKGANSQEYADLSFDLTGDVKNVRIELYMRADASTTAKALSTGTSGTPTFSYDMGSLKAGSHTYRLNYSGVTRATYDWVVVVENYPVQTSAKVYNHAPTTLGAKGGVAVVTDPESAAYGKIVTSNGFAQGFNVYSPTHTLEGTYLANTATWTASSHSSLLRIASRDNGLMYAIDLADAGSGIWTFDPANPTTASTNIFSGTKDDGGCWTYNGVALGGGGTGLCFTGTGASTALWSFQYDYPTANSDVMYLCRYDIGTDQKITKAPVKFDDISSNVKFHNKNVNLVADGNNGLFVAQVRSNGQNTGWAPGFVYIDLNGNVLYNSSEHQDIIPSCGSGMALSADRKLLAVSGGTNPIRLFDVTWASDGTPTLTYREEITGSENTMNEVTQLAFDVANNLVAYQQSADANYNGLNIYSVPGEYVVSTPARISYYIDATTTSVEDVAVDADDATPVYYDLRGVRMPDGDRLAPGLYLKVTGHKTEKVRIN